MAEVNFLAVHKDLRSKRLAQIMIQEMMRRKRKLGLMQAFYTSVHTQPTPFVTTYFCNRFLNPKKLVEVGYTQVPPKMTMKSFLARFQLPEKKSINLVGSMRPMLKKDASVVLKLFNAQMEKMLVRYKMSEAEILHYLLPRDGVLWTWVLESNVDGKVAVTDFFSMRRMTQQVIKGITTHKDMHSAVMWYYGLSVNKFADIMKTLLWLALEECNCDAFTAVTVM